MAGVVVVSLESRVVLYIHRAVWNLVWSKLGELQGIPETAKASKARSLAMMFGSMVIAGIWMRFFRTIPLEALCLLLAWACGGFYCLAMYEGWLFFYYKTTGKELWLKSEKIPTWGPGREPARVLCSEEERRGKDERYKLSDADLYFKAGIDFKRL